MDRIRRISIYMMDGLISLLTQSLIYGISRN